MTNTETVTIIVKELDNETHISLLQYENLRKHFSKLIDDVLGPDYYNEGMDVYTCDEFTCRDLKNKLIKNKFSFKKFIMRFFK